MNAPLFEIVAENNTVPSGSPIEAAELKQEQRLALQIRHEISLPLTEDVA
jgi:hypothetical protein